MIDENTVFFPKANIETAKKISEEGRKVLRELIELAKDLGLELELPEEPYD